jgi:hypothetical protein
VDHYCHLRACPDLQDRGIRAWGIRLKVIMTPTVAVTFLDKCPRVRNCIQFLTVSTCICWSTFGSVTVRFDHHADHGTVSTTVIRDSTWVHSVFFLYLRRHSASVAFFRFEAGLHCFPRSFTSEAPMASLLISRAASECQVTRHDAR